VTNLDQLMKATLSSWTVYLQFKNFYSLTSAVHWRQQS